MNLLDQMKSYNIIENVDYIEAAIFAQHGGFPSRLLDVSYNALIALYFAINDSADEDQDAYVYIFEFDEIYSASSEYVINLFDTYIKSKTIEKFNNTLDIMAKLPLLNSNYKLIDAPKQNKRIIAQQGAFIMFPEFEYTAIDRRYFKKIIKIKSLKKKEILNQLNSFFGINEAHIYPDLYNEKDIVIKKTVKMVNKTFSLENEIKEYYKNVEKNLEDMLKLLEKAKMLNCNNYCDTYSKLFISYKNSSNGVLNSRHFLGLEFILYIVSIKSSSSTKDRSVFFG